MRQAILLIATTFLFSGCLKHDVLKLEATGHFTESDFYNSGDFEKLQVEIENITVEQTLINGTMKCRPVFTIRLKDEYAMRIEQYWEERVDIVVFEDGTTPREETFSTTDYYQSFNIDNRSNVDCGNKLYFNIRLTLPNPKTGQVVATTTKQYYIQT